MQDYTFNKKKSSYLFSEAEDSCAVLACVDVDTYILSSMFEDFRFKSWQEVHGDLLVKHESSL